jgi:hypothetical protein
VYCDIGELEASIRFCEELEGVKCERRVVITETGIEAAKVGGVLILAGDSKQLDAVRYVNAIYYLDSLDEFSTWLSANGAEIIHLPRTVTAGRNLTARHPDGLVVKSARRARDTRPRIASVTDRGVAGSRLVPLSER